MNIKQELNKISINNLYTLLINRPLKGASPTDGETKRDPQPVAHPPNVG